MKNQLVNLFLFILLFHPTSGLAKSFRDDPASDVYAEFPVRPALEDGAQSSLELRQKNLSLNEILSLALQHNPKVRASLSELPLVKAEGKQAALPEAPQLNWAMRFPVESPDSHIAHDLGLTQNVMDLIQSPKRRQIGNLQYQSKVSETRLEIFKIVAGVKVAYFRHQAALQLNRFYKKNLNAAQAAASLASAQRQAGNISELDESQNKILLKLVELEYKKTQQELIQSRIALAREVGVSAEEAWHISQSLPKLPTQDPKLESLQQWAQENRSDILAGKQEIKVKQTELDLARRQVLPRLDVGVSAEWDAEGGRGLGPQLGIALPVFGQRSVAVNKAQAGLQASEQKLAALKQGLPYDLEETYQRLRAARQIFAFYQKEALPLQQNILDESLKHYNYMLLGNYELLQAKQNQLNSQKNMIEAQRDYWLAYAELESIVGTFLENIRNQEEIPKIR